LLALALPFGAIRPLTVIDGVSVTHEKLVLLIVLGAWVLQGWSALPTAREWRILLPSLVLVLVTLISAKAAAGRPDEALGFASRLAGATFVLLLAVRVASQPGRARALLWAVAIGGGVSALLGIGEALGWPLLSPLLAAFKVAPTRVAGELRVSASFQYATIAAMYFEMVAPLAIVLAATARQRWQQNLGVAIGALCTASVVLSLTRAGMLTLALVFGVLIAVAVSRRAWRGLLVPSLGCAAVLLGGAGLLLLRNPVFDLRLVTESDADWYGAVYSVPAALTLDPNQSLSVAVETRNEGRMTWTSGGKDPFALGYRWLTADGSGVLDVLTSEVPLPHDVEPGQTINIEANLAVPNLPAGTYRLDWSMLQRHVLLFYERGWADAETRIDVVGSGGTLPTITPRDDWQTPWAVGRLDLWSAAVRLFASHPLLGVGPDNFRHLYGAELGLAAWDERVQANNLYLEVLADFGALGLAIFAWVVAAPLAAAARALRSATGSESRYVLIGVVLSIGAFLTHGLLDSFLAFTPTALLLWMLLGLAAAQNPQVSGR
jgi:O-antigen ligase